jgi:hypothetical protein
MYILLFLLSRVFWGSSNGRVPRKKRPFYTYPVDSRVTLGFDCLLLDNVEMFGLKPEGAGPGQREGSLPVPAGSPPGAPVGRLSLVWTKRGPEQAGRSLPAGGFLFARFEL